MSWPGNYAGQALTVAALEKRLADLQKIQAKVVVHAWQEPSQQEFESAYVAQTGFTLPIRPGTILLWSDMRNGGLMRPYTVANDKANGTQSSGTVVPYIENQTTPPFRFLGHAYARSTWAQNNVIKITAPSGRFLTAPSEWQRRGLAMLWVYFSIRLDADAANTLLFHPSMSSGSDAWTDIRVEIAGQNTDDLIRLNAQASTENLANSQNTSAGGSHNLTQVATDDNDEADAYMNGVLYVWDPFGQIDENDALQPPNYGSAGIGYAASIGASIATGLLHVNFFAYEKTDNVPSPNGPALASALSGGELEGDSKIWWYGIFSKDAPMLLTEYS